MAFFPEPRIFQPLGGTCSKEIEAITRIGIPNLPGQGYRLTIRPNSILIEASDQAGGFYGEQKLAQLKAGVADTGLPCCRIEDWPDFAHRGYMLDISRDRVPTMGHLFHLVDCLASLRYNQLQLYTEHTFAYEKHSEVWQHASPMTADEIRELDVYCRERHIELVANQNSFGHMERWLKHPSYRDLAECPNGFEHPLSGWRETGSVLRPDGNSLSFVDELFSELAPCFSSQMMNVGGDEPWELGQGWSKARVERIGKQAVYLEFLSSLCQLAERHGKRPMVWADILLEQPESISELAESTTPILWGYEADHPFREQCAVLAKIGREFYIAPGDSTWSSYTGRLDNMIQNIESAVENGLESGASGILATHWGDGGHPQTWPISLPGMVWAGLKAWNAGTERTGIREGLRDILGDIDGDYVDVLLEVGRVDETLDCHLVNRSYLTYAMGLTEAELKLFEPTPAKEKIGEVLEACDLWLNRLSVCRLNVADSSWLFDELRLSLEMTRLAAEFCRGGIRPNGRKIASVRSLYKTCWLRRSRSGGMADSLNKMRGFRELE